MIKNFISVMSNPTNFSPTIYLVPEILKYEGHTIVHVHIPSSAEVHSYKKVIYDRVDDADVKVTATAQIAAMYIRKQNIFTEKKIYPYASLDDLRLDLLPRIRKMAVNNAGGRHPWENMSDQELLMSAGLYGTDIATGEKGYNLAAILLLGKDDVIMNVCPAYETDALMRKVNVDRYDDREIARTNLIESFDQLMEFTSSYAAKFVIQKERMYTENANRAVGNGLITPDNLEPNPKNPLIASFFRNIGRADRLGSGVINLFKYSKFYSGQDPEFREGDVFQIVVPLDEEYSFDYEISDVNSIETDAKMGDKSTAFNGKMIDNINKTTDETTDKTTDETTDKTTVRLPIELTKTEENIIRAVLEKPSITQNELAENIGLSVDGIRYAIKQLKVRGILSRKGSKRYGTWQIHTE